MYVAWFISVYSPKPPLALSLSDKHVVVWSLLPGSEDQLNTQRGSADWISTFEIPHKSSCVEKFNVTIYNLAVSAFEKGNYLYEVTKE